MKSILLTLIFYFSCLFLYAQQDRFIYLQNESKEPFFVKLDNKIYTSSPSGYLIIPKLSEGLYSMAIGFAQTDGVQEFNCSIKNKDIGYIIKSNAQSRLQLLNVQSLNVIVPEDVVNKPVVVYEKVSDPFSKMLANAVHDSTILRKDILEVIHDKVELQIATDSAKVIASAQLDNNQEKVDSTSNVAQQLVVKNDSVLVSVDTTSTIITEPQIAKIEETLKLDSPKVDLPADIVAEKSISIVQSDSTALQVKDVVSASPVNASDTTTMLGELNSANNIQSDSVQKVPPVYQVNDVAIKSKTKKNKTKIQSLPKTEVETEKMLEIRDLQKDSVSVANSNRDEVVEKTKKRKSKAEKVEKKEVEMTVKTTVTDLPSIVNDPIKNAEINTTPKEGSIKRKSRKTTKEGIEMTYVDDQVILKDTIKLLIPVDEKKKSDVAKAKAKIPAPVFLEDRAEITVKTKSTKPSIVEEKNAKEPNVLPVIKATMVNSDCKSFANDDDFLKMRKKMVAEDKEMDMVKAARKVFKTKCFTTEQIKNLSVLFLKDEGKFMFFDAAYAFVSDSESFHKLEKQLTEVEYINRFKTMVKK